MSITEDRITTARQRERIDELARLVADCAQNEVAIRRQRDQTVAEAKAQYHTARQQLIERFEREYIELNLQFKRERDEVEARFTSEGSELAEQEKTLAEEAAKQHAITLENAKQDWQTAYQKLVESLEAEHGAPKAQLARFKEQWDVYTQQLEAIHQRANRLLRRRGCPLLDSIEPAEAPPKDRWKGTYLQSCAAALQEAQGRLRQLRRRPAARLNEMGGPFWLWLLGTGSAAYPAWQLLADRGLWFLAAASGLGLVCSIAGYVLLRIVGRRQTLRARPALVQAMREAKATLNAALETAERDTQRKEQEILQKRKDEVNAAHAQWARTRNKIHAEYERQLKESAQKFQAQRDSLTRTHQVQIEALNRKYPPRIQQMEKDFESQLLELNRQYREQMVGSRQQFDRSWQELVEQWRTGIARFREEVERMNQLCAERFPPWDQIDWQSWRPPGGELNELCFGRYVLDLQSIENGLPREKELHVGQTRFVLPAVLSYPDCPSLLLEAEAAGRDVAVQAIQNVMLRLLTSLPPGKVRFTIIDPVGLGQNFSVFMHLADYDEQLVTNRIWTEGAHINQRLADLTEHMENVIQKYLRNEFASIQEYNERAGEVAEPFQILVVANFPAGFSEESTRRLVSIASSGARCGVYTLISVDLKMKLPRNFDLADLESHAVTLQWTGEGFRFKDQTLGKLPLTLDQPPDDQRFTEAVRAVGQQAKDASRVEVPFQTVVPRPGQWWAADSRGGIEVPLGRAGATKLQYMRLGKGTSQHVLVSGKTGSGKSTLLHALITNLALYYSPDQVQFYLIDFKKGVEFKAYATWRLPHARVIAIESEREFGLSVLQRLDAELRHRGDLFRAAGVQDIAAYRDANPDAVMPRILLIIDEFQELFVSDDRIAQESGLLLDRLVRQGRAFGIHVLLGSQTLAGAYSLARSTLGQMAVRIALQCSETDAHLILSEDNTAARLLSRPGEAIYNDANGLFEGNHPFQVVWLPDHERDRMLERIGTLAAERKVKPVPPIVFEGNVAANPAENPLLRDVLRAAPPDQVNLAPRAWLGAAVEIKDPTSVVFHRHSGSNVLIVGQQRETALGLLANAMISLAAQQPAADASDSDRLPLLTLLDGAPPESVDTEFWVRLAQQVPLDLEIVSPPDLPQSLQRVAAAVHQRVEAGQLSAAPHFLIVYDLARFRQLRKADDFGFSGLDDEGPPNAARQLVDILRDGPAVGVHTLIWCDSFTNVTRWLDRQALMDLALRVLLQMSAADSSNLMDSPAASRLGVHRAILYNLEQGQSEKFRPYGLPSAKWLAWVRQQLAPQASSRAGGG